MKFDLGNRITTGLITGVIIFLLSCQKEEAFTPIYDVPEAFQSIVEQFELEAKACGLEIEINNLIIKYDESVEYPYCATCNSKSMDHNIQKIILINPDKWWLNDFAKEALIFHELGHCILGRDHDNSLLPNGDPKSMMVENNILVYSPCIYAIGGNNDCNFTFKRDYYISELFDENTVIPEWANNWLFIET